MAGWFEGIPNKLKWTAGLLGGVALVLGATTTIVNHLEQLSAAYCRLMTCEATARAPETPPPDSLAFGNAHAGIWKGSIRGRETDGHTWIGMGKDGVLSICKLVPGMGSIRKKYADARAAGAHLRYTSNETARSMHYDLKVYDAASIVGSAGDADDKYIYALRRPETRTALEARVAELDLAARCRYHP